MLIGIDIERLVGKRQRDAPPTSPSYTLAEWRSLALNYCDEWERETKSTQTEFRLMLSLMFESLGKKEREANG